LLIFPNFAPFQLYSIAVKGSGNAYDAFVTRFLPHGKTLRFSTYVGGNGQDYARSVALDAQGNAVISGYTSSTKKAVESLPRRLAISASFALMAQAAS